MSVFSDLEKTYTAIDQRFAILEFEAARRGWVKKEREYADYRSQNDQAFFLYFFTRLEDHITTEANRVINKGKNLNTWRRRAPWEELNSMNRNHRLRFMSKVSLLAQAGQSDYNKVQSYYGDRNTIAHGGVAPISMSTAVPDMKTLHKNLRAK